MKNKSFLFISTMSALALSACFGGFTKSSNSTPSETVTSISSISEPNNTGDFSLTDESGNAVSSSNNVYTISSSGTYIASGKLDGGYIYINAGSSAEVEIDLNGASIISSSNSPIYSYSVGELKVKAMEGTSNLLKDIRSKKTGDVDNQGEGVISAKADLSLTGKGTLVISGTYNNGIHTTKDLTIKNQTLQVTVPNNAIKGKDSITVESGTILVTSTEGDGLKTDNSDLSSKGLQRGKISILDGTINVNAYSDGLDSAYDVDISGGELLVKVGEYSSQGKADSSSSQKGIKAENNINISNGTINVYSTDDALHANYGNVLDNGNKGQGNINVSGGEMQVTSKDDALHADNTLTITGGIVSIPWSHEGLEANYVNMSGGQVTVIADDDGVNGAKNIGTPDINISGGILDVTVNSGDTDGIDSNGTYHQSGGAVIVRGPTQSNQNMGALDTDGGSTISGGTLIAIGAIGGTINRDSSVCSASFGSASQGGGGPGHHLVDTPNRASSISLESGDYSIQLDVDKVEFSLSQTYSIFIIYSNQLSTGNSYTLKKGSSTALSWSQSSATYSN